jgi:hypothetical protein
LRRATICKRRGNKTGWISKFTRKSRRDTWNWLKLRGSSKKWKTSRGKNFIEIKSKRGVLSMKKARNKQPWESWRRSSTGHLKTLNTHRGAEEPIHLWKAEEGSIA